MSSSDCHLSSFFCDLSLVPRGVLDDRALFYPLEGRIGHLESGLERFEQILWLYRFALSLGKMFELLWASLEEER